MGDTDDSGGVDNKELINLMKATFPGITSDPKMTSSIEFLMKEAIEHPGGSLDFQDYLRLTRAMSDLYARIHLYKEHRAIKKTGFSSHEVYEFRELFLVNADAHGLIKFDDFTTLIASVLPIHLSNLPELFEMWMTANSLHEEDDDFRSDEEHSHELKDFGEFLWLMRKILDSNFGGVLEHTKGATLEHTRSNMITREKADTGTEE